jgi:hypothetical protein
MGTRSRTSKRLRHSPSPYEVEMEQKELVELEDDGMSEIVL